VSRLRCAVVGGGILGAAVARRLQLTDDRAAVTLLEKEPELARHQTGRNSGVVHAGLYYPPGSLKARLCRRGAGLLRNFCAENAIAYLECGKVLVALDGEDERRLDAIEERARGNGVPGIRRLHRDALAALEPHVRGVGGLHSPSTAVVDYPAVTRTLASQVQAAGGVVRTGTEVVGLTERAGEWVVSRTEAAAVTREPFDLVVICAGLHSDRVARLAGDGPDPRIVPFRGEYYLLAPGRQQLVNGLVYPVPDPRHPFLGVHLTPRVDGEVMVGPNAVLALAREGYDWQTISGTDLREAIGAPGFRRFARRNWRIAVREAVGSLSTARFVAAARRYVPELRVADVVPGPAGNRAQALDPDGSLVDDFRISRIGRVVAVRNAPSPAATSAFAIAEYVVGQAMEQAA